MKIGKNTKLKMAKKPRMPKEIKKGRPTNLKREAQGHINTYDFKFEEELKRPLNIFQPNEVEKILFSKGFIKSYVNRDIRNLDKEMKEDNAKRLGILWFRYTHPQIPKISGSNWSVGICLKTTLMENPRMSLSFVLYNENLIHHIDLDPGFEVSIKAQDRNKIGIESALIKLFEKYQDLQKFIIRINNKTTVNEETKKELVQMFAKARLVKPFTDADEYKKSSVDFSDLDNALKSYGKITKLIDLVGYYNHMILSGEQRIKYINGLGGKESAGAITSDRRTIDLQKAMSEAIYQYLDKKSN